MATFTNTGSNTVKVMFKVDGKRYNNAGEDYTGRNTATESDFPWDEVLVAPGATVNLGNVVWQKEVDMGPPQTAVVRVGPPRGQAGDIVNGGSSNVMVRYRVKGRTYGAAAELMVDTPTETFYPWEEAIVAPGRAFYVDSDIDWTKSFEMKAAPAGDPNADTYYAP